MGPAPRYARRAPPAAPLSLAAGAAAWEPIGHLVGVSFFPPLSTVLVRLADMAGNRVIFSSLGDSLLNLVLEFAISLAAGLVNGEMFIAVVGLGRVVTEAGGRFDSASVPALLLGIIAVALGGVALVQVVDRRITCSIPKMSRGER
ncbi:hypothetical protein [Nonomuraea sp. JJY05]|uniref:hypothetical protein n=1 Tax=Nonomuraea sp. JJY05 TaxID=3350255 RepID=UPI00373FA569